MSPRRTQAFAFLVAAASLLGGAASAWSAPDFANGLVDSLPALEEADLSLTKTVNRPAPAETDSVTWIIQVANSGPDASFSTIVQETLPAGVTYLANSRTQGSFNSGTGAWNIGMLGVGAVAELQLITLVNSGTGGQTLTNHASITSSGANDTTPGDRADSASITVQIPDIDVEVKKDVNQSNPTPGDAIVFKVEAKNKEEAVDGVVVSDLLPAGLSYAWHTATHGTYDSGTGQWTVGHLDRSENARLDITVFVDTDAAGEKLVNTAFLVSPPDINPSNDSESRSIDVKGVSITLTKTVDNPTPNEGDTVLFTITATNASGSNDGRDVEITDALPAGLTYAADNPSRGFYDDLTGTWYMGDLNQGHVETLQLWATVDTGTAGSSLTNQAWLSAADPPDSDPSDDLAEATVTVPAADLQVSKVVSDQRPYEGDNVIYTIAVWNEGPNPTTGVTLNDLLPAGVTHLFHSESQGSYNKGTGVWNVGAIAVGDAATLAIMAAIDAGTAGQTITNTVTSGGSVLPDQDPSDDSADVEVNVRAADLTLTNEVSNPNPFANATITYTVQVTNAGPDSAHAVAVTDVLSPKLSLLGASATHGTYSDSTDIWTLGDLPESGTAELLLSVRVLPAAAGTIVRNIAAVTAVLEEDPFPGFEADTVDISVPFVIPVEQANLQVTKVVDQATPRVGDTVVWTVNVTNHGPDNASNVDVADDLAAGLTPVGSVVDRGSFDDSTGVWTIGTINVFETVTLDLSTQVEAALAGDTASNYAHVTSSDQPDPAPGNNSATAIVTVQAADLAVQKSVDDSNPTTGGSVVFTIVATNAGPDSADVVVSDPLPAGLSHGWNSTGRGLYNPGSGLWNVGAMASGDSATLQIGASVTAPGGATLFNVASISAADQADPSGANNVDSTKVEVQPVIGLAINATQPAGNIRPGVESSVMSLFLVNSDGADHKLTGLAFTNTTAGPGTPTNLDEDFDSLGLWADDGDFVFQASRDTPLGRAVMTAGRAEFPGLGVELPSFSIGTLHVSATPSTSARDGDVLDVSIADPSDITLESPVPFEMAFPVTATGGPTVDGCVAGQIVAAPLAASEVAPSAAQVLALDMTLPANGYVADSLRTLRLTNLGSAVAGTDLGPLKVWRDGGNGAFDAGATDDVLLGTPLPIGSVWSLGGLSVGLPTTGRRIFASVDVAATATVGRTLAFAVRSLNGLVVDSGNDGPVDAAGPLSGVLTIQRPPSQISVSASQGSATLLPGGASREVFRFVVKNLSGEAETLQSVTLSNATTGPGTVAERDAEWRALSLERVAGIDIVIGGASGAGVDSVSFAGGQATFSGVAAVIAVGDSAVFRVLSGASLVARDGDTLDLSMPPSALGFDRSVTVVSAFPISPAGSFPVDGMSAAQLKMGKVAATLLTGEARAPALIATVPANGYEADALQRFDVINQGTAPPSALTRLELWRDTGDNVFDPTSDTRLGDLVDTGARWEITGLGQSIPTAGARMYVTVDVTEDAGAAGQTVRLAIPTEPDMGIGVASANDGPRDVIAASTLQTISTIDRVAFSPVAIGNSTVAPGAAGVPLLVLSATNRYASQRSLVSVRVTNATTGPGSTAELDGEVERLVLWADDGDGIIEGAPADTAIATSFFAGDAADFDGFVWTLDAGATRRLFVTADVSGEAAADGDLLAAVVTAPLDLEFSETTVLAAAWPLDAGDAVTVDGMVASQIAVFEPNSATIGADDGPFLALDLGIPGNGYIADQLESITIVNAGTATSSDLAEVRLWRDGGDGVFDAGAADDVDLGLLASFGSEWTHPSLGEALAAGRTRFFVSVLTAASLTDSATVRLQVPVDGLAVASADDGPRDQPVTSPTTLLLSDGVLLASIAIDPSTSTVGAPITVRMTVRNVHATATIDTVTASSLAAAGVGSFGSLTGPTPAYVTLAPGASEQLVWTTTAATSGTVRLIGGATGREVGSGLVHQSLDATSNEHQIFVEAQQVQLFAVQSMPFSLNRGQTGVVPLSLTFENSAGPGGSAIRVNGFRLRLEDEIGGGVVPAALLSRVLVHEGAVPYIDKTSLETSGSDIDLTFAQPLVLPSSGSGSQATVAISLDVSDSTSVPSFRVLIDDESAFVAQDATSGAPVAVDLRDPPEFPIASGLARVVAEASRLDVTEVALSDTTAGRGQTAVRALRVSLLNPDPSGLAADVRVGSFSVVLTDSGGVPIASPASVIGAIRVRTSTLAHVDRPVGIGEGPEILLSMLPLISVPVNTPVAMDIELDIAAGAPTGPVQLQLFAPASFDARDANTGASLPVYFAPDPLSGPRITVQEAPALVVAAGTPQLPSNLPVGAMNVAVMSVRLVHPGGAEMAPVRIERVDLFCRDDANQPLAPSTFVDAVRASAGGTPIAEVTSIPATGAIAVPLSPIVLAPGAAVSLDFVVDLEVTSPPSRLSFLVEANGVDVRDANLGTPIAVEAASGESFPFGSGLTQLVPPARQLAVGIADAMPAVLAGDETAVRAAAFSLRNVASPPAGSVTVDHLTLRASDRAYAPVSLGQVVRAARLLQDATVWAEVTLSESDSVVTFVASTPLVLEAGVDVPLELELDLVTDPAAGELRVGIDAGDVGVVQPGSPILQVAVSAEEGRTFPLWTDVASFTPRSLGGSYSSFPNPFAAGREPARFAFWMPRSGRVSLKVFSLTGDAVRTLLDGAAVGAGLHQGAAWDGRNGSGEVVRNGVYIAELSVAWDEGGSERHLRKVAVVR